VPYCRGAEWRPVVVGLASLKPGTNIRKSRSTREVTILRADARRINLDTEVSYRKGRQGEGKGQRSWCARLWTRDRMENQVYLGWTDRSSKPMATPWRFQTSAVRYFSEVLFQEYCKARAQPRRLRYVVGIGEARHGSKWKGRHDRLIQRPQQTQWPLGDREDPPGALAGFDHDPTTGRQGGKCRKMTRAVL